MLSLPKPVKMIDNGLKTAKNLANAGTRLPDQGRG
jgi:hypothetical protein